MCSVGSAVNMGRGTCSRGRFPLQTARLSSRSGRSHLPDDLSRRSETVDVDPPDADPTSPSCIRE